MINNLDLQPVWEQYTPKAPLPFVYERPAKPAVTPPVAAAEGGRPFAPEPPPAKKSLQLNEGFSRPHPLRPIPLAAPSAPQGAEAVEVKPANIDIKLAKFLDRLADNLWVKPYACDGKDDTGLFLRCKTMTKEKALTKKVLQINGPRKITYLTFDIDKPHSGLAWQEANLPMPNLIVFNPDNGHSHYVYELAKPIWLKKKGDTRRGDAQPVKWLKTVRNAMNKQLGADPQYTFFMVKNPFHPAWRVRCLNPDPYTLAELACHLDIEPTRRKVSDDIIPLEEASEGVRRTTLYSHLAKFSYGEKQHHTTLESFIGALDIEAESMNRRIPQSLPYNEVDDLVHYVGNWTWNNYTGRKPDNKNRGILDLDKTLPIDERQRIGQNYTAKLQPESTLTELITAINTIRDRGLKPTKTLIAKIAGRHRNTVARHWEQLQPYCAGRPVTVQPNLEDDRPVAVQPNFESNFQETASVPPIPPDGALFVHHAGGDLTTVAGDEIDRFFRYTKPCDLPIPPPIPKIVEPPPPKVFKQFRNTVEKRSSYVARMRKQGIEVQYYPDEDDETLEPRKSAHKSGSVAKAKQILKQFGTLLPDPLNRPI
jgi:replicase family protein